MARSFTVVYAESSDGGYVGYVEEMAGAYAQGETLDEVRSRLREALDLALAITDENHRKAFGRCRVVCREQVAAGARSGSRDN